MDEAIGAKFAEFIDVQRAVGTSQHPHPGRPVCSTGQQPSAIAVAVPASVPPFPTLPASLPSAPTMPYLVEGGNITHGHGSSSRRSSRDGHEDDDDAEFALSALLRRLAAAELGGGIRFRYGTQAEFQEVICDAWDRNISHSLEKALRNYDEKVKIPRVKSDRIDLYWNLLLRKGAAQ